MPAPPRQPWKARYTLAIHRAGAEVLEWCGVLTWQHRVRRIRERCTDLFGQATWCWRVIRTSNSYAFSDPKAADCRQISSKSEKPAETQDQDILDPVPTPARDPNSPLERALARFGAALSTKLLSNEGGGTVSGI